tara:strand:- start:12788 stop:13369 length:582 start_codon:yes stop_codon:yes gene_type:complete
MPKEIIEDKADVNHVWSAIDDLRDNIGTIKTDQATLLATMEQVSVSVNNLNSNNKTPWGVIWSAVGVMIIFLTAAGGSVLAPLYMANLHVAKSLEREREDRITQDNTNNDSSISRHIAANDASQHRHLESNATALQQHESLTALITQDKTERRGQLTRIENYFDAMIMAHMEKLVLETETEIDITKINTIPTK